MTTQSAIPATRDGSSATDRVPRLAGRSVFSGALIGVGGAAFVDESVFHQILHWHHFYDLGTPAMGLVSDGLFHAVGFLATVIGFFLLADLHRRHATVPKRVWAGFMLGFGGFEVYDGLFQHKVLHIHQIRYHVNLLPYDLTWNITGAVIIVIGVLLLFGTARSIAERRAGG